MLAGRLRLPEAVRRAVLDAFERFDGHGVPEGRAGAEIAEAARFAAVGYAAVMFEASRAARPRPRRSPGGPGARSTRRSRRSSWTRRPSCCGSPARTTCGRRWSRPSRSRGACSADEAALDEALAGFGDAADLKSPWFTGHSRGVARLARARGWAAAPDGRRWSTAPGWSTTSGGSPSRPGVWERPGPLRAEDWELVRLHPYHTGRILARSPVLAPLGQIASRHHERAGRVGLPGRGARGRAGRRRLPARRGRRAARAGRAPAAPARARSAEAVARHGRAAAGPRRRPGGARCGRRAAGRVPAAARRPDRARAGDPAQARRRPHQARRSPRSW